MTRSFSLTDTEWTELIDLRHHASLPSLRERTAALLNVDAGQPAARVARHGLLRPRKPATGYAWLDRYLIHGVNGLRIRAGRGRKPACSPLARER